ncbi:septation protein SepH [Sinomonas soli]
MRERAHDQAEELRLVGVHEDGAHLIVSAANGDMFRLPLDEALRRAVARPAPQRPAPSGADGAGMTPRQIQAEIRAGATAEEVAASSGVPLARVQRFEGPVLAEREHMARRAQAVEVPGRLPTQEALRGPAADRAVTLGEMAAYRLSLHGVPAGAVEWDSWRRPDGQWTVVARFALPEGAPSSIGEEPPAVWTFHPGHRTVANANRWAQQLSELEPLDGPAPRRRLAAVSDRPFDVEAAEEHPGGELDREGELLDMLRARRGQRLGVDEDGDDALALLLTHGIPAAHPRSPEAEEPEPEAAPAEHRRAGERERGAWQAAERDEEAEDDDGAPAPRGGITSLLSRLNVRTVPEADSRLDLRPGVSTATTEMTVVPSARPSGDGSHDGPADGAAGREDGGTAHTAPQQRDTPQQEEGPDQPDFPQEEGPHGPDSRQDAERPHGEERPHRPEGLHGAGTLAREASPEDREPPRPETGGQGEPTRRSSRPKRSSVPSWDEIVFGTKGD